MAGVAGQQISIELFNVLGESVGMAFDGIAGAKPDLHFEHVWRIEESNGQRDSIVAPLSTLPAGVYFWKVTTADTSITKKIVLLN